uniref:Uncharacterized protein n=1 Tax=Panagrolaimus davidi TaxID=227884 RepID=A0A914PCA9_9BILA
MGDHGPNVGEHRFHETVALEEKNPMLYFSTPKSLRNTSKQAKKLKANSKKLISHYDLYATFIDIAESLGADISSDITFHGQSLFTSIPDGRDCRQLGISPMYCNCRYKRAAPLTSKDPLFHKIIEAIFKKVNETMASHSDKCKFPIYSPNFQPIMQEIFYPGTTQNLKIFRVIFETQPDNARWETAVYVKFFHNSTVEIQNFLSIGNRLNPFGPRCDVKLREICFCKDS